ncbi:MAG: hypothetical protein IKU46_11390 [Peptococcaceae bacterium]|nr:hypothetical protein [Peptococcaceae bacterium]
MWNYEAAWDTREQFISDFLEVNNITPNEKAPVLSKKTHEEKSKYLKGLFALQGVSV